MVSHQSEEGRFVKSLRYSDQSSSNPDPRSLGTFTTEPKPSFESPEQGEERVAVATGVPGLQSWTAYCPTKALYFKRGIGTESEGLSTEPKGQPDLGLAGSTPEGQRHSCLRTLGAEVTPSAGAGRGGRAGEKFLSPDFIPGRSDLGTSLGIS